MTKTQNLLWWLTVSFSAILTIYSVIAINSFQYLMKTDSTFISLGIVVLYSLTVIVLGYLLHFKEKINFNKFWFISELMLNLGLIGTLIGLAMTFSIFVFGGGLTDDNTKELSSYIANGTGAAITTTLVGLIYSVFLKVQLAIVDDNE